MDGNDGGGPLDDLLPRLAGPTLNADGNDGGPLDHLLPRLAGPTLNPKPETRNPQLYLEDHAT